LLSSVSVYATAWGLPVVRAESGGESAAERLLAGLAAAGRSRGAIYTRAYMVSPPEAVSLLFMNAGWGFEPVRNFVLPLHMGETSIWKRLTKGRRSSIRRAEREGVRVLTHHEVAEPARSFYRLYSCMASERRLLPTPLEVFEGAGESLCPKGLATFAFAVLRDTVVASSVYLHFRDTVTYWFAGHTREGMHAGATDLIKWHTIQWAASQGYAYIDMGGAGTPGSIPGIYEYKKSWGGDPADYGRFLHIHRPVLFGLISLVR
jgi:hypothetical protein